ncbi:GATOR1 complex protein NPRL3-like [Clavelina lepadiformis]|uniref:GATOR1 complex protein NPRL3-like n=1 Tax=Clavelina lepadiformis TaxID=159417 RepID=UPI004042722C
MEKDPPWAPLAIMLSMYGRSITNKLLFKYPFEAGRHSQSSLRSYKQLTSSTYHLNQSNSTTNEEDEDECCESIRDEAEQYLSFSDKLLAQVTSPANTVCGQKFDVKINGLRFVGFPLMLEHSNIETQDAHLTASLAVPELSAPDTVPAQIEDHSVSSGITVTSYNVVFVLRTAADYSVVEAYQQLATKLGVGLRFEEKQMNYVTSQFKLMLSIHEDPDMSEEQVYQKILEQSSLAQNLRYIFDFVESTGILDLSLNENLRISFCLFHKVLNSGIKNEYGGIVDIKSIEQCLNQIQPYHGLLVYDHKNVWDSLTDYCSMSIVKFLNVYNPTKSLQLMSTDADIAMRHVFTIARHLVLWGKACVIYPLCETNVYFLAPTASLNCRSKYIKLFSDKFNLNLTEVLNYFSTPVRLGDYQSPTGAFFGNEKKLVEIVIWMLQHRFLVQHQTYVYFLPVQDRFGKPEQELKKVLLERLKTVSPGKVEHRHLPHYCREVFQSVPASRDSEDLTLFLRLLKYFDGKHHLEEMMYRENMVRHELVTILEKFQSLLLTCDREDEIAAAFCMPT